MLEQWTAQRAISSSVSLVLADMRPKDFMPDSSSRFIEAYAVFSDNPDTHHGSQFIGIVPQHVVGQFPYRIFADLLPLSRSSQIAPDTPLEDLSSAFQKNLFDTFSVIGNNQHFLGAVTSASLWKTLFQRERYLSAKLRREIHEKHNMERQLKKQQRIHNDQLTGLSKNLIAAEKQQRKQLATELHDHLAQWLAVGRLKVAQTHAVVKNEDARKQLTGLDQLLQESIMYTRDLMAGLNPSHLRESDLRSELNRLADRMLRYGLTVTLNIKEPTPELPENHIFNLYWSIQELLFNVMKHAGVEKAHLEIGHEDHRLQLSVSDKGKGFPEGIDGYQDAPSKHLGLYLIRERMAAIDGTMMVFTSPGKGTMVQLTVPLSMS